jgi:Ca2+-binding EF-hand superfamily protein
MQWILAVILGILPVVVLAEGLPATVVAQVQHDPAKYLDDLSVMISGFGVDGAIDRAGLQNVVAMARADARATAMRRLQGADLDGDGAVSGDEMRMKAAASAASARGRLILYFGKADVNGDDRVSAEELQAYANLVAQQSFSEDKAAAVYAILGFDKNGDGRVNLAEVKAAIALVGAKPPAAAKTGVLAKPADKIDQKLKI